MAYVMAPFFPIDIKELLCYNNKNVTNVTIM